MKKIKKTTDEIERESNRLLESVLEKLYQSINKKILPYRLHELKEKGIDYIIEIEDRWNNDKTGDICIPNNIFYIQNKGKDALLTPLSKGVNKGKISYQFDDVRQIEYFCFELDQPLIIILCDISSNNIYWCPIQLESNGYLDEIEKIKKEFLLKKRKTKKIQIYVNPLKCIYQNGTIIDSNIKEFITDIEESKKYLAERYLDNVNELNNDFQVNENLSIIDQIDQLFTEHLYSDINFVPVHILANYKPFSKTGRSYYNSNVIHTDNEKLQDFFNSVEISDNKTVEIKEPDFIKDVENPEIKISSVLKKLTTNLVYSISHNHQKKDIRLFGEKCDCIVCQIDDYRFEEIKNSLKTEQSDLKELLKYSYANYKVGDFEQAYTVLLKAKEVALKENKQLSLFIINYNLHKLQKLNQRYYTSDTNQYVFSGLKINLDLDLCKNIKGKDSQIIKWIYDDKFLKSVTYSINEFTSKIRISYNNSLNGGSSSNGYVQGLVNGYVNLESFLRLNFIMYDSFTEYKNTFQIFMEGLYASHSITNKSYSKLVDFDDWLLLKILNYGDHEKMIKFFSIYKLNS